MTDSFATMLVHDDLESGPVVPPIHQSSLFTFDNVAQMVETFSGGNERPIYTRGNNPTVRVFEDKIAALEGGEAARGFASGMAAIAATILAFARSGDRIVCVRNVYPDTYRLMRRLLVRLGIETVFVDGRDLDALEKALEGASLLYLESPTSVIFETHDIRAQADLARQAGAVSVIDNSWATPVFQRPLALGVDIVVHSASKYISGHSDTVAGVAIGSRERIRQINTLTYPFLGGKLAPFEAWLLLRGLRTLGLRMRRHNDSVTRVSDWMRKRPEVAKINLPELSNASGALSGRGGLFSIELADGVDPIRFCDTLRLFRLGVSWGGHESLVFPMAVGLNQAGEHNALVDFGVPPQLVRLNIGLEEPEDLVADLDIAIRAAARNGKGSQG
ncbi:MAG: PLP-dependent transferase [Geminicoccaceae bacterium]|nr:PLP-dependent transferase [Geminicoccaceae bacterium]